MQSVRHHSQGTRALQELRRRGLTASVTYYQVPPTTEASANWSTGTVSQNATQATLDVLWADLGSTEAAAVRGGGIATDQALVLADAPTSGDYSTRDYLVRDGVRWNVTSAFTPLGANGQRLLTVERTK